MKIIRYKFLSCEVNHGTEENLDMEQVFLEKFIAWSEANVEIAKREAWGGEYTIEDDGVEESTEATWQDTIEAQVTYTAMMTDTLLGV